MSNVTTREDDEMVLKWLRYRYHGFTTASIAKVHGFRCARVRTATNRVKDDDIKYSQEPRTEVQAAYW